MKKPSNTFNRLSLDHKIIALILIEVIGFCVMTWVAYVQVKTVGNEVRQMVYVTAPLTESFRNIETQINSQRLNSQIMSVASIQTGNRQAYSASYQSARSRFAKGNRALDKELLKTEALIRQPTAQPQEQVNILSLRSDNLLDKLFILKSSIHDHRQSVMQLTEKIETPPYTAGTTALENLKRSDTQLLETLDELISEFDAMRIASTKHAVYVERIAIGFIILTSIATFIFFITMLLLIVRKNISKPLRLLTDTINAFTALHKVNESEFEMGLMQRGDELGRLSRSFNRLKYDLWSQGQDLHDAKDEAEKANRAKSDFLAAASHDLRQPLHAMQMYIAALRQKIENPEALKIIDNIDAVSVSTAGLLGALLDVSQLEAGAIKPRYENFSVQEVLSQVYRAFSPAAQQKNLDFRLAPSGAYVKSDPVLLERILGNFMSNAVRYTQQGRVLLGCRRRGSNMSIEVWDTGCGIPESEIMAIFEDFHQIDNVERDRSKGLGLGLGIAQRLTNCLGHEIECNSIAGLGSRFAVIVEAGESLPKKEAEADLLQNRPWDLSGICVLLIEDDKEVLKATQQLLISWGCKVYLGRHLDDVLRVIQEPDISSPDIIIADFRLPGGADGMEVATRVQLVIGQAIPTVIVTGDVEEGNIRGIADQGYRVLTKPVQPAKLRALISHLTTA